MRVTPKPRYPSADHARLTRGEVVAYYLAGIFGFEAIVLVVRRRHLRRRRERAEWVAALEREAG